MTVRFCSVGNKNWFCCDWVGAVFGHILNPKCSSPNQGAPNNYSPISLTPEQLTTTSFWPTYGSASKKKQHTTAEVVLIYLKDTLF